MEPAQEFNPQNAPLGRKLLAVKVFSLCILGLVLSFTFIDWLDSTELDIPRWLEKILIVMLVIPFFTFILALKEGVADLIVHFIPESRIKRFLLWGDRTPETIAKEFSESGYAIALLPFLIPIVVLILAAILFLVVGGGALVFSAFNALWDKIFEGWPPWAIVITFLLILVLLKK